MKTSGFAAVAAAAWLNILPVQAVPPPLIAVEEIGQIIVVPGQPIELSFPNEFDLLHSKRLSFDGVVENHSVDPAEFSVTFDWLDDGELEFSDPFVFELPPLEFTPISAEFEIPFCPERVSIHFEVLTDGNVLLEGEFTHECVVPEGTTWVSGAALVAALGGCTWARRRSGRSR